MYITKGNIIMLTIISGIGAIIFITNSFLNSLNIKNVYFIQPEYSKDYIINTEGNILEISDNFEEKKYIGIIVETSKIKPVF